jgi:hypothetical protein
MLRKIKNKKKLFSQSKPKICFQRYLKLYIVQSKEKMTYIPLINSTIPNISLIKVEKHLQSQLLSLSLSKII